MDETRMFLALTDRLRRASTPDLLAKTGKEIARDVAMLPEALQDELRGFYRRRMDELKSLSVFA